MSKVITELKTLLGSPVVFIQWPARAKGSRKKWKHLTPAHMTASYLAKLPSGNIGIALGDPSGGLISIDRDNDEFAQAFDAANPHLAKTFRSKGVRPGNVWLRMSGPYPKSCKLRARDGAEVGEFRATGNQTIVYGQHPDGVAYTHNGLKVLTVPFESIVWPTIISTRPTLSLTQVETGCTEGQKDGSAEELNVLKSCSDGCSSQFFTSVKSIEDALSLSVPRGPQQNNKLLFTLARAIKSIELNTGPMTLQQRLSIFREWYQQTAELNFLRPGQTQEDYQMEFLNACRTAKHPIGSAVIGRAWSRAQASEPPPEAMQFQNPKMRLLVSLCRELQIEAGAEPFYLSSRIAQLLLGQDSHTTAASWLGAFVMLEILTIQQEGTTRSATRYRYTGGPDER